MTTFITLKRLTIGFALGVLTFIGACQFTPNKRPVLKHPVRFTDGIDTILESRCLECHNHVDAGRMAGLNLENRKTAFTTGTHAPVIVPGSPEESLLYRVLEVDDLHPNFMPPTPDRLWHNELQTLYHWIKDGADWPTGASGKLVRPQDWPEP